MKIFYAPLFKMFALLFVLNFVNATFAQEYFQLDVTPMRLATTEIALQVRLSQKEIESIGEQTRRYLENQDIAQGSTVSILFRIANATNDDKKMLLAYQELGVRRLGPIDPYYNPLWNISRTVIDETSPYALVGREIVVIIDDKKTGNIEEATKNAEYTLTRIKEHIAQRANAEISLDLTGGLASKVLAQKILQTNDSNLIGRVRVAIHTKTKGAPDALSKWELALEKTHGSVKRQLLLSELNLLAYLYPSVQFKLDKALELSICEQSAF